jgi:hypothetical protein
MTIEEKFADYDARLKASGVVAKPEDYFKAGYLFGTYSKNPHAAEIDALILKNAELEGKILKHQLWESEEIDTLKAKNDALGHDIKGNLKTIVEFYEENAALRAEVERLRADAERYRAIHTPEISNFVVAIESEALHQRERWGNEHDAGKSDADWFWLVGYLAGKGIRPEVTPEKQLHHIITTAAACLNWHAHKLGVFTNMRPGIDGDAATAPAHGN